MVAQVPRKLTYVNTIRAPILNTPSFPFFKESLLELDDQKRLMVMETVVEPGTLFTFIKEFPQGIFQVTTPEYPSSIPLYVDSRFLTPCIEPESKELVYPSIEAIFQKLNSALGTRYFWGGTHPHGIQEMLQFYPNKVLDEEASKDWTCTGLDCSGLLKYAALHTPRNTSELMHFGKEIANSEHALSFEDIQSQVKPLDIIVWKGHVIIVREDTSQIIESLIGQGVSCKRLEEWITKLRDLKTAFTIRRWHPQAF